MQQLCSAHLFAVSPTQLPKVRAQIQTSIVVVLNAETTRRGVHSDFDVDSILVPNRSADHSLVGRPTASSVARRHVASDTHQPYV
jgi:hypothetical protein